MRALTERECRRVVAELSASHLRFSCAEHRDAWAARIQWKYLVLERDEWVARGRGYRGTELGG